MGKKKRDSPRTETNASTFDQEGGKRSQGKRRSEKKKKTSFSLIKREEKGKKARKEKGKAAPSYLSI